MSKPVTPSEMFDLWQKMVNPGAYPLQSLMFPVLDPEELEKKIGDLETVEHWLKANLNMLELTIKSLQYQRAMLKGGEKLQAEIASNNEASKGASEGGAAEALSDNPAMWAWNMMSRAGANAAREAGKRSAKAATAARTKATRGKKRGPST